MKRICLVDFDYTLIKIDTLEYIFYNERWYFDFKLFSYGVALFFIKNIIHKNKKEKQIPIRSLFKKYLLTKIVDNKQRIFDKYIKLFRNQLNDDVINHILKGKYDQIILISASFDDLIEEIFKNRNDIKINKIIASSLSINLDFQTCWNINKIEYLNKYLNIDYSNATDLQFELYTDSYDDMPLMNISKVVYLVKQDSISKIKGD